MSTKVKDLILSEEDMQVQQQEQEKQKKSSKSKPSATYTVEDFGSGDFCIHMKSARMDKLFVWLLSQKQFYIKDNKTGQILPCAVNYLETEKIRPIKNFFSRLPDLPQTELHVPFLGTLTASKSTAQKIAYWANKFLNPEEDNDGIQKLIMGDFLELYDIDDTSWKWSYHCEERNSRVQLFLRFLPVLQKEYSHQELKNWLSDSLNLYDYHEAYLNRHLWMIHRDIWCLLECFGLDNTRKLVQSSFLQPSFLQNDIYGYRTITDSLLPVLQATSHPLQGKAAQSRVLSHQSNAELYRHFEISAFIDYYLFESAREGMATDLFKWASLWCDVLRTEERLYGKIREKYPKNLSTYHDIISYRYQQIKLVIDEARFARQTETLSARNWKTGDYLIRAPKSQDDFLDEAEQQNNCLASYVDIYCEGESGIYFLRRKEAPDISLVTIEIRKNGEGKLVLRQAYRASNQRPSPEEMKVIRAWCRKFDIQVPNHYRPQAA